jgi:hypothetical protein
MAKNVLILATRYDRATTQTFRWAKELQDELIPYVDSCFLIDVTGLCRGGKTIDDVANIATHVIYYGHGEPKWWTALPGKPDVELIGLANVHLLKNAAVYAVCCSSLVDLGKEHARISNSDYVGYDDRFRFDLDNEDEFRKIVNQSAVNFVLTGNAAQTVKDLQNEWTQLANDFAGPLKLRKGAVQAGSFATGNAQRIGIRP